MNDFLKINQGIVVTCCVVFPALLVLMSVAFVLKSRKQDGTPPAQPAKPDEPEQR